ncbi:MAG: hypothetical protein IPH03_13750 [Tetrasphaera sp.]|nr:hypothetical protein [Tetrasphaera sp.]
MGERENPNARVHRVGGLVDEDGEEEDHGIRQADGMGAAGAEVGAVSQPLAGR